MGVVGHRPAPWLTQLLFSSLTSAGAVVGGIELRAGLFPCADPTLRVCKSDSGLSGWPGSLGASACCRREATCLSVPLVLEEETGTAGLLGRPDRAAREPGSERSSPREVCPGELHLVGQQAHGRALQLPKKEDN